MRTLLTLLIVLVIAGVGAGIGYNWHNITNGVGAEEELGGMAGPAQALFGTRSGTSTTDVDFGVKIGTNWATTTYPTYIGGTVDEVVYYIGITAASTTAHLSFDILTSTDPFCATASTTYNANMNNYTTGDVLWYDAGDHLKDKVHSTSLSNATSTLDWVNPLKGQGREIVLENLSAECIALEVSGSSTEAFAEILYKQF